MSFVFGLSLGNVGWVLSDTQLNFELKTGQRLSDEREPFSIVLDNVGGVRWGSRLRKLAALANGYVSGAGDAVLCRLVLDELQDLSAAAQAEELALRIASVTKRIRTPLFEQLPGTATLFDRTTFITLQAASDGPALCSISADGRISNFGQEYVAAWPPDIAATEVPTLMESLSGLSVPSSLEEVYKNVSVLSRLASEVQDRSCTVGRCIDIGMTIVDRGVANMGHISGFSSELASMSPRDLSRAMLEQRMVPC